MSPVTGSRPGGRSARVQAAVHAAARELDAEQGRAALTVPMVAARAGVTPSTIYRRWGDLTELFSDVAVERLRPESDPDDEGGLVADLEAWAVAYVEEMSSAPGRVLLRDTLQGSDEGGNACHCADYALEAIEVMRARAIARGESPPDAETVLDGVVAPLTYRVLFRPGSADPAYARRLVANVVPK